MTITCQLKNLTSLFRLVLSRSLLSKYTPPEVLSSKLSSQGDPVPTLKFARWSWCRHSHRHFGWTVSLSIHPPMSKSHSQIQAGAHIFHWSDLPQWSVDFPHNCHENRPGCGACYFPCTGSTRPRRFCPSHKNLRELRQQWRSRRYVCCRKHRRNRVSPGNGN